VSAKGIQPSDITKYGRTGIGLDSFRSKDASGLSQMKLKSRHFENYPISGNQKPLRAFFTHIWGYFVQCDYTLLRMTDQ